MENKFYSQEHLDSLLKNRILLGLQNSKFAYSSKPRASFFRDRPNTQLQVKHNNTCQSEEAIGIAKKMDYSNILIQKKNKPNIFPIKGLHILKKNQEEMKTTQESINKNQNKIHTFLSKKKRVGEGLLLDNFLSKSNNKDTIKLKSKPIEFKLSNWINQISSLKCFKKDLRFKTSENSKLNVQNSKTNSHDTTACTSPHINENKFLPKKTK